MSLRQGFVFLILTAVIFFTHLIHHTDDPNSLAQLSPKEWVGVLRQSSLGERAVGLQQWVSNRSHSIGIVSASRQFASLEDAESRLKQTLASISQPHDLRSYDTTVSSSDRGSSSSVIKVATAKIQASREVELAGVGAIVSAVSVAHDRENRHRTQIIAEAGAVGIRNKPNARGPRSTNKGFVVSDAVTFHPRVSPRNGTDISTEALRLAVLHCKGQSKCIVPALQLAAKLKIYYCKHPVRQGVRFWNLIHEGLLMHPNVELLDEANMNAADFLIYLPGSAPWHRTECANASFARNMIVVDEFDFHNLYYPRPSDEEVIAEYGSLQWYFMYYKRSFIKRKNGTFLSFPHFDKRTPEVYPLTYALAEAYTSDTFNFQREIEILCTLRGSKQMSTRLRVQEWVAEYGVVRNVTNMTAKQVNRADRTGVSKEYFEQMYNSQIIVTVNPAHWEGDFRLWESFATGALVMVDPLFVPHSHPLIDGVHVVYFSNHNKTDLFTKLDYYRNHRDEARRIAVNGYLHAMKYHRTVNLIDYVLRSAHLRRATLNGQRPLPQYAFTAQYLVRETRRQTEEILTNNRPAILHPHGQAQIL